MVGMRRRPPAIDKAMPTGECGICHDAVERIFRAGKMHAANESRKCITQLDGFRRHAEGARKRLLCAKKS